MKKVLIISTVGLNYEGITSVIYNYISHINSKDLQFEFIAYEGMDEQLRKKFEKLGRVLLVPKRKENIKGYIAALDKILNSCYDVVHVHGNSGTMVIETVLAKRHKVKTVIVHSHNTTCDHPVVYKMLTPLMKLNSDIYIGCSDAAGKWLFGRSKYIVLNNAIDLERFQFDPKVRENCREELGLKDEYLIGHVGLFTEQKNHDFLIDVFFEFHKIMQEAKLLLVSDGPEFDRIKNKVSELKLTENVIFAGKRSDVYRLYQAMDLFLFPSLWEGLPLVMVEAQTNGLPLLVSDTITKDAKCTNRTLYKCLDDGAASWANEIWKLRSMNLLRSEDMKGDITRHGFDIVAESDKLKHIYLK